MTKMKVYFETLAKDGKWSAADMVLSPCRKTSNKCDVRNRQTSSQASLLLSSLLERFDFDDVRQILVFVDDRQCRKRDRRWSCLNRSFFAGRSDSWTSRRSDRPRKCLSHKWQLGVVSPGWRLLAKLGPWELASNCRARRNVMAESVDEAR